MTPFRGDIDSGWLVSIETLRRHGFRVLMPTGRGCQAGARRRAGNFDVNVMEVVQHRTGFSGHELNLLFAIRYTIFAVALCIIT